MQNTERQKPAYEEKDMQLRLRQAANAGDLKEVKRLLEDKNLALDINAAGGKSGNAALHFASASGHIDVVEYLVLKGANIDLGNGSSPPQTALDLAKDEKVQLFLKMIRPLKEAIAFAKAVFPMSNEEFEKAENAKEMDIKSRQFREKVAKAQEEEGNKLKQDYKQYCIDHKEYASPDMVGTPELARQNALLQQHQYHCASLKCFEVLFREAKKEGMKQGRCGARTQAAYAYLVLKGYTEYAIDSVAVFDAHTGAGHQFLFVGRKENTPLEDIHSKGYGLVCDAYGEGKIFSNRNTPANELLHELGNPKSKGRLKVVLEDRYHRPDSEELKFGRKFFENYREQCLDSMRKLFPGQDLTPVNAKTASPKNEKVKAQSGNIKI